MAAPLILIADNDRAVSSLLVEVLARKGLRTICAFDGEAAAELVRDPLVAVLVCDLDMPKRHGLEVLEAMPASGPRPPTVVVSGYLDREVEGRLGALDFVRAVLKKPFDLFGFAELVGGLAAAGGDDDRENAAAGVDP